MDNKFILQIFLGAVLVTVCPAAPNIFSFLSPEKKEVRIEPRVEVVQGPSFMVQGTPNHVVHGRTTHVVQGPTHVVHGGPTHVIHGGPTHVVHGPPTHVVHGGPTHVVHGPPPMLVGHVVPGRPYPHPAPIYQPGKPEQCICTEPSNCRKTHGLHRYVFR